MPTEKTTIYYNGDILTMDGETYVEAVRVENGIITNVGTLNELMELMDNDTELVDLKGAFMMPSFIDTHSHLISFAKTLSIAQLGGVTSTEEIIEKLRDFQKITGASDSDVLLGFGYDQNMLEGKQHPTRDVLDKAFPNTPVVITPASGHMGVMNSTAFEILGIDENTPDPSGGLIGRYEGTNIPNGYLEEKAFMNYAMELGGPDMSEQGMMDLIDKAENVYLSYGITTVQDALIGAADFAVLKRMSELNKFKTDVIGFVDLAEAPSVVKDNPRYVKKYVNRLKIGGYKIFLDGSPQGRTAWMTEPYENSGDYTGYPVYPEPEVVDFIKISLKDKLQLQAHCNGDAAAAEFIAAFQQVVQEDHVTDTYRPVMIHSQLLRPDQLAEMKKLGMIPSFFPAHVYYWGDVHIENFGMDRASKISPSQSAVEEGMIFTLHQDSPVIYPDMLETVWAAVNRVTMAGVELGPEERISPYDALKAITVNAAYQNFEEESKGSLTPGKQADMVILDKNPLKVPPETIKDIAVLKTINDGAVVYEKK